MFKLQLYKTKIGVVKIFFLYNVASALISTARYTLSYLFIDPVKYSYSLCISKKWKPQLP